MITLEFGWHPPDAGELTLLESVCVYKCELIKNLEKKTEKGKILKRKSSKAKSALDF